MPAPEYQLTESSRITRDQGDIFRLVYTRPDGQLHGHFFPADTLAWRAAELGLDLDADREQLIEVVLHEPWMETDQTPPANTRAGRAAAHLARVADAKTRVTITHVKAKAGGPHPLDILREHRPDPARVAAIHAHVHGARQPNPLPLDAAGPARRAALEA
ncbi:hypothetical protein [Kitasatospora camelliae]|uniref:Lsr2 protein n=1 Tax=Kitasatospora camelliae TaxID=3156397 RepID=A0AAU8K4D7_9ACTN